MNNNGAGINERKAGLGCELFSLALEALFAVARCDAEKPYSQVGNPRYFHGVRRTVGPLRSWGSTSDWAFASTMTYSKEPPRAIRVLSQRAAAVAHSTSNLGGGESRY